VEHQLPPDSSRRRQSSTSPADRLLGVDAPARFEPAENRKVAECRHRKAQATSDEPKSRLEVVCARRPPNVTIHLRPDRRQWCPTHLSLRAVAWFKGDKDQKVGDPALTNGLPQWRELTALFGGDRAWRANAHEGWFRIASAKGRHAIAIRARSLHRRARVAARGDRARQGGGVKFDRVTLMLKRRRALN
jgi:hypothetical protein